MTITLSRKFQIGLRLLCWKEDSKIFQKWYDLDFSSLSIYVSGHRKLPQLHNQHNFRTRIVCGPTWVLYF